MILILILMLKSQEVTKFPSSKAYVSAALIRTKEHKK